MPAKNDNACAKNVFGLAMKHMHRAGRAPGSATDAPEKNPSTSCFDTSNRAGDNASTSFSVIPGRTSARNGRTSLHFPYPHSAARSPPHSVANPIHTAKHPMPHPCDASAMHHRPALSMRRRRSRALARAAVKSLASILVVSMKVAPILPAPLPPIKPKLSSRPPLKEQTDFILH